MNKTRKHYGESAESFKSCYSSDITIIFLYVELTAHAYNDLGLWSDWTRTMVCVLSSCYKTEL